MRLACLPAAITAAIAFTYAAAAFEIEERASYVAPNPETELRIISTADRDVFEPILLAFQEENETVSIDYTIASTTELMKAVHDEGEDFDLVISSAMDLQTKLANDGFAQTYRSNTTDALPDWAKWRDQVFAFTQEPAVLILSDKAFPTDDIPTSRDALITLLREQPDRFRGKIGTYDVRTSGFGYMMATQDARVSENFWRLLEVMGRLDTRLYCCSGAMLEDVRNGELAVAYNVLGSYAQAQLADEGGYRIVLMSDFANIMLRTAVISSNARNVADAQTMVDFLTSLESRPDLVSASGLPAVDADALQSNVALRPIRLGPGLLAYLDRLTRRNFLRNWEASITQE
ncbi:MAG: ABC transporter substrate-binding protein [Boseongicola sp.]|nr:ABC transporter substrate-binding protein [Boseongicola sp.]NNL18859.1 ABC transporter substrate-binding protein [Boseongicola sp.]